jgi:hypothetical protein
MDQFMNRLLTRANKNEPSVRPVFAPEMIPETLKIPQHMLREVTPKSAASSFENNLPLEQQQMRIQKLPNKSLPTSTPSDSDSVESKNELPILPQTDAAINHESQVKSISSNEQNSKNVNYIPEKIFRNTNVEVVSGVRTFAPNYIKETQIRPNIPMEETFVTSTKNQSIKAKETKNGSAADNLEPTVTISIGRIEVRAIMPEKAPGKAFRPALSLEDYLKRRREKDYE